MNFTRSTRSTLQCVALAALAVLALRLSATASAEEKTPPLPLKPSPAAKPASAEREIRATAVAFVEAFNRGDAKAVAALWTNDGTAADDSGTIFKGRAAIEAQYAQLFRQHPGAKMEVAVKSIDFPTLTTAIEDGIAQVDAPHAGSPQASRYTVVHVKQDGKWLMASEREASIELPSNFARVESLDWLVGTWKAERDGKAVHTTVRWIANKSFLERDYTIRQDGIAVSSGKQIIGWDPKAGQIRSWSFDASGGTGTGLWTATPEGWQIVSSGVLPDGTPTASRDFLIRVPGDDNVLGWRSVARSVGGASLPDTPEAVLDRISEK